MISAETVLKTVHFTKTRIAPTPSGYLHLGNVFSFVITATLAEQYGAKILLRIDDMDRQRAQPAYIQDIFDTLDFLALPWHEGPRNMQEFEQLYSQIHRLPLYRQALDTLKAKGVLFACDCSRAQLQQADSNGTYTGRCQTRGLSLDAREVNWRMRTAEDAQLPLTMLDHTTVVTLPPDQKDFVVRKKDGFPAYQITSVVDDAHFGVDFIVRGTDLWTSTVAQLYLADTLALQRFSSNTFYHHRLLMAPGGAKLSKSAGATSIQHLRKNGKRPEDIFTMIAAQAGIGGHFNHWLELGTQLLR